MVFMWVSSVWMAALWLRAYHYRVWPLPREEPDHGVLCHSASNYPSFDKNQLFQSKLRREVTSTLLFSMVR